MAAAGIGLSLLFANSSAQWWIVPAILAGAIGIVALDMAIRHKRIDLISSVYFGLLIGIFLTFVFGLILTPFLDPPTDNPMEAERLRTIKSNILLVTGLVLCYVCISVLWQTKDDFRFVIPYIEFAKETKGLKPYILDTSVVIDGRIADIVETGVLDNQLIMPRFALNELQNIADSSDKMRRSRGRRGLDILQRLRSSPAVDLEIYERELPEMDGQAVDMKLVMLARHLNGKIVTGDFNLNKVARLQNVPVINLNEVANSLKPVFLPGEQIEVKIVKAGEEPGQGVGYLVDGTMVVVEDGRGQIGHVVPMVVTSMLQTNAGRRLDILGRPDRAPPA